ncbi:MAG TPA: hypothetical protein DCL14_02025 [Ruminococcaceae bacterium]|nr:hypothetical protein [Oscillospiraceae bacterium]
MTKKPVFFLKGRLFLTDFAASNRRAKRCCERSRKRWGILYRYIVKFHSVFFEKSSRGFINMEIKYRRKKSCPPITA